MNNQKYSDALQILNAIVIQDKSVDQIFFLIQKCRCEIEIGRNDEAKTSYIKIIQLLTSKVLETANEKTQAKCLNEVESLVEKLIEIKKLDEALLLIENQFNLIKQFYSGEEKLDKLVNLGIPIQTITEHFHFVTNSTKANNCYLLLDKILHEMQTSNIADFQHKTKIVAWFMHYYGECCSKMNDYTKSIEVHSHAIFLMKSIFGHEAGNYQVYGYCHHNFGCDLKELHRFDEAKQKLETSLNIYESATDWGNDKQKKDCISLATDLMNEINIELQSHSKISKLKFKT